MIHEFHFVLRKNQKEKIKEMAKNLKMSKSKAVMYIIKIMKPFLERHFYSSMKDYRSEYQRFGAQKHIHVFLDDKSYNIIKHITDNMYIFSMAITLRKILEIFIKLTEESGLKKVKMKLKRIRYRHLRRMINIKSIKKDREFRQLSGQLPHVKNFYKYQVDFSRYYTVLNFNFCT